MTSKKHFNEIEFSFSNVPRSKEDIEKLLTKPNIKKWLEWLEDKSMEKIRDPNKVAYPVNDSYMAVPQQYDQNKWIQAAKDIYYQKNTGSDKVDAVLRATNGWNIMEKYSFLNWLKFYQEGAHLKYKFANLWYENGSPGYFLEIKPDKTPSPAPTSSDIDDINDAPPDELSKSEKQRVVKEQRTKLIKRLDSVEKLLRSEQGQLFAGKEFSSLLDAIYDLKKKIHTLNSFASNKMCDDLIIRQSNMLKRSGFNKAADILYSVAEESQPLTPPSPDPPNQVSGAPGGLPSMGPGAPQTPPESAPNNMPDFSAPRDPGMADFLEEMNGDKNDILEVEDHGGILITEAQAADLMPKPMGAELSEPVTPIKQPLKPPVSKPSEIQVSEDDVADKFDHKMDALLSGITISDVIAKLEDLAKVFRVREIPRQLSIVDMMLDSLGLASFFPALSESINKSLESNNYISSRIDDVLSKLRGTIKAHDFDLTGETSTDRPELQGIKNKLDQDAKKEKARKEMRKDQEAEDLGMNDQAPDIEVTEEEALPTAPVASKLPPPPAPAPQPPVSPNAIKPI